jgi:HSP20 family protein
MPNFPTRWINPPLATLPSFRSEINRLFDDFLAPTRLEAREGWLPALDVSETPEHIKVLADLPGVDVKDVHVELVGNTLSIHGEKKSETERKGDNWLQVERCYGRFQRSIALPDGVDAEKVKASSHDGVLTIEIAKTEATRPRSIPVKAT